MTLITFIWDNHYFFGIKYYTKRLLIASGIKNNIFHININLCVLYDILF